MYTTISTSIKSPFILLVFLAVAMASCQGGPAESPGGVSTSDQPKAIDRGRAKKSEEKLTDGRAKEFLTQYAGAHDATQGLIKTRFGNIKIRLYENTPLHRANFLYLSEKDYFDDTWFYRVSKGHVIQAGNTDGRATIEKRDKLGDYHVPSEIEAGNYHKYGAVAAARSYSQNPEKESDPYEFYIVLGRAYSRGELKLLAEKHGLNFSQAQLGFYENRRGAPHLDGQHTVFGEVVEGMDVVEKINAVKVDEGEWPLMNIPIQVETIP